MDTNKFTFNIGDVVVRKVGRTKYAIIDRADREQRQRLAYGIVVSQQMAGDPSHPCITVYYPKVDARYDIGESLMEKVTDKKIITFVKTLSEMQRVG